MDVAEVLERRLAAQHLTPLRQAVGGYSARP